VTATATSRIRTSGRLKNWINRLLGGTFVYLGARMAMFSR